MSPRQFLKGLADSLQFAQAAHLVLGRLPLSEAGPLPGQGEWGLGDRHPPIRGAGSPDLPVSPCMCPAWRLGTGGWVVDAAIWEVELRQVTGDLWRQDKGVVGPTTARGLPCQSPSRWCGEENNNDHFLHWMSTRWDEKPYAWDEHFYHLCRRGLRTD